MYFKKGAIVTYDASLYTVKSDYKGVIVLEGYDRTYHHGVTIPRWGKSYKRIKLYLPEILKKL